MVCGTIDTVIIKPVDKPAIHLHDTKRPDIALVLKAIIAKKPTLIVYKEDRGICS